MKVIVVSGPTATGKTGLAVELALKFSGQIVNFDSLLLYKEINIGTAKPTLVERLSVPHHMIDVRSISDPMTAADFARESFTVVEKLLQEQKLVFLVGGSGFYLQALLKGMYQSQTTAPEIIQKSDELFSSGGIGPFLEILKVHDPLSRERYHQNDHYRIRRAVEYWWSNGQPISLAREQKDQANSQLAGPTVHGWDILHLYLDLPKLEHLEIIQRRARRMLEAGLLEEVRGLLAAGFQGSEKPLKSIGYKETLDFLRGEIKTPAELEERIVISTRQLAKAQRTWFNRDPQKETYHPLEDKNHISQRVAAFLNQP
ncbi:MAG TPA: tRNA (adenosine(37)-N6)-dimethylallyltransferase MiaA [Bacteriovoracaceae bacterium]|nr:tRNA (adenosine(37)-N6)-dimethylallyltransferase MiaA [Bacteriovoracaceae bacterium]